MQEKNQKPNDAKAWLSGLFLLLALWIFLLTVKTCCPQAGRSLQKWLGLAEGGRAQAAFRVLESTLSEGGGAAQAFAKSHQALVFDAH